MAVSRQRIRRAVESSRHIQGLDSSRDIPDEDRVHADDQQQEHDRYDPLCPLTAKPKRDDEGHKRGEGDELPLSELRRRSRPRPPCQTSEVLLTVLATGCWVSSPAEQSGAAGPPSPRLRRIEWLVLRSCGAAKEEGGTPRSGVTEGVQPAFAQTTVALSGRVRLRHMPQHQFQSPGIRKPRIRRRLIHLPTLQCGSDRVEDASPATSLIWASIHTRCGTGGRWISTSGVNARTSSATRCLVEAGRRISSAATR